MSKVWGGGIYELDEFYEIADELGILIWQVNCKNMIEGSKSWQPFLREQKFTCKSALLAQETLFLTPKSNFFAQSLSKSA